MGLFDFFKKKSSYSKPAEREQLKAIDSNSYLLEILRNRLSELGYEVERHPQYLALIINSEIEIATAIIDNPNNHPSLLHVIILAIHPKYFPQGIEENIVGVGTNIQDKVDSAVSNYLNTTFLTIIESFSESHNPDLDFYTMINGKDILWHPKLGSLSLQGRWTQQPENEPFYEIIKDRLHEALRSNKFNWLKLYISKRADGKIIGECLFNNEPWQDGLDCITEYAESWEMENEFKGMKQFIMFRKCDAYDE